MKLWGGRFASEPDVAAQQLTRSFPFDKRLYRYDILGSIAHARMLGVCGIIEEHEAKCIIEGLQGILADIEEGNLTLEGDDEDIHSFVERVLTERIGPVAGKLHTARSRNDQVVLDARMFVRDHLTEVYARLTELQATLLSRAKEHISTILPGFTHLQHAQPVSLAHYLLAYFWMLQRDRERLQETLKRTNILPLGAAALAGTSFPIDRQMVARELGFAGVAENSMDAVADRDFILEALFDLAMVMLHLSRLCEELILWNTAEFGFVEFDERFSTGSSIMPQKKNPDVAEIARGKTGRVIGNLMTLLSVMKSLPLAYHTDMQEDKEALFDSVDTVLMVLPALTGALRTLTFHAERMKELAGSNYALATDLADYLVQRGIPFRQAHTIVGKIVRRGIETGKELGEFRLEELQEFHPDIEADVFNLLTVEASVASRRSEGGTSPERVREQIKRAEDALGSAA